MNEVRPTQVIASISTPAITVRAASSRETDTVNELPPNGKELSIKEDKPTPSDTILEKIEQSVTEINEHVQSIQRDIHFSVDKDSGMTVIRVRDKESGELIRQIPEDVFLDMAQKLNESQTFHLFDSHG